MDEYLTSPCPPLLVGWYEWAALPLLGVPALKVKVDTGAKTSCLHAFNIELFKKDKQTWVRFDVHPLQNNDIISLPCEAPLVDHRWVTNSGGYREYRYVIKTHLTFHHRHSWEIELTLTNRDALSFRMLLGREAMKDNIWVNPSQHSLLGRISRKKLARLYNKGSTELNV